MIADGKREPYEMPKPKPWRSYFIDSPNYTFFRDYNYDYLSPHKSYLSISPVIPTILTQIEEIKKNV